MHVLGRSNAETSLERAKAEAIEAGMDLRGSGLQARGVLDGPVQEDHPTRKGA